MMQFTALRLEFVSDCENANEVTTANATRATPKHGS